MQPHSMCAVALSSYIWNRPVPEFVARARMDVEYRNKYGEYRMNKYELEVTSRQKDDREFNVYVIRAGGGISCTLTVRRNSTQEGAEVTMTHSQQHVSGLREVYRLMKKEITGGLHYNSEKYGAFKGWVTNPDNKKMDFMSEVKNDRGQLIPRVYQIRINSVS